MQVTNEMVERAAKSVEKRIKQSKYGWSDEDFETYWTKDPRFIEQEHSWGDAFGRGTEKNRLLWKVRIALEVAISDPQGEFARALTAASASMTADPLCDAAPELLDALKLAVARVRMANDEGNPILSAWLPGAQAAIFKAEGATDARAPQAPEGMERMLDALRRAERFMSGFEDDLLQEGIDVDLDAIRSAIAGLEDGAVAGASASEHFGRDRQ